MTSIDLYTSSPAILYRWTNISFALFMLLIMASICFEENVSELLFLASALSITVFFLLSIIKLFLPAKSAALIIDANTIWVERSGKRYSLLDIQGVTVEMEISSFTSKQKIYRWGIEMHLNDGSIYYMKKVTDEALEKIIYFFGKNIRYKKKSSIDAPFSEFASNFAIGN